MTKILVELPTFIQTPRLLLRSFEPGDGAWYYTACCRNREHLSRYESDNVAMTIDTPQEAETVIQDFISGWEARRYFFIAVFNRHTQEFVAQVYLGVVNAGLPEVQIGYFADVDHQGRGFVTEAVRAALDFCFQHLGAQRVRLECDDTNERSYRVAERCGMQREGHIREHKRNPDGSLSGTLIYGLLRGQRGASE